MKPKMLISACLLGYPCRYDGKSKPFKYLKQLKAQYELIPICPEQLGGLRTPRPPAEIINGKVITQNGQDVTKEYELGAQKALYVTKQTNCCSAVLKSKSPSCGKGIVHNGKFDGGLIKGYGKTAELFLKNNITIFDENEAKEKLLGETL